MSVTIECDNEGCEGDPHAARVGTRGPTTSPWMGEDYAKGRYVYTLPNGWVRHEDRGHLCPKCAERLLRKDGGKAERVDPEPKPG